MGALLSFLLGSLQQGRRAEAERGNRREREVRWGEPWSSAAPVPSQPLPGLASMSQIRWCGELACILYGPGDCSHLPVGPLAFSPWLTTIAFSPSPILFSSPLYLPTPAQSLKFKKYLVSGWQKFCLSHFNLRARIFQFWKIHIISSDTLTCHSLFSLLLECLLNVSWTLLF